MNTRQTKTMKPRTPYNYNDLQIYLKSEHHDKITLS